MSTRERFVEAAKKIIFEEVNSTKEIIQDNIVPSFEDMSMATNAPGEFGENEITDAENLINQGKMANDNDFNKDSDCGCHTDASTPLDNMQDLVDISANDSDDSAEVASIEIVKTTDAGMEDEEHGHEKHHPFGESLMAKAIYKFMDGKSCEQLLKEAVELKESNYAGPLNFVPDLRISVADVVSALKNKIGEGSEAIHIDQIVDERKNNAYKVSQIDHKLLPKKLQVENVLLELDGDVYKVNKPSESFPLAR